MVTKIKVYMEGGGDKNNSITALRKGMTKFLEKATDSAGKFQVIPCGSRQEALRVFKNALNKNEENLDHVFLLVDSEAFVNDASDGIKRPKQHLQTCEPSWDMQGIKEDQIHFMAQVMESWFIADVEALAGYYGQGFNRNAISTNNNVEEINKSDIEHSLERAIQNTTKGKTKGKYEKIKHGAEILEIIDPKIVRRKASYCDRFLSAITNKLNPC